MVCSVLIWTRPNDQDVLLKLGVKGGAAFDLAGKGGGMALLGNILFRILPRRGNTSLKKCRDA